jgi:hypothetical protein
MKKTTLTRKSSSNHDAPKCSSNEGKWPKVLTLGVFLVGFGSRGQPSVGLLLISNQFTRFDYKSSFVSILISKPAAGQGTESRVAVMIINLLKIQFHIEGSVLVPQLGLWNVFLT